jgi:hypothetical protein
MTQPKAKPIPPFDYSQSPGALALLHSSSVAGQNPKVQTALAAAGH